MNFDHIPRDPERAIILLDCLCIHGAKHHFIRDYWQFLRSERPLGTKKLVHYEDSPLLGIIDRLSDEKWLPFILTHKKPEIFSKIMDQLARRMEEVDQLEVYFQNEGRLARQLILICAKEGDLNDEIVYRVTSQGSYELPQNWATPGNLHYESAEAKNVSAFLHYYDIFWTLEPWHERRDNDSLLTHQQILQDFSENSEKPFIHKNKIPYFSFISSSCRSMAIRQDSIPYILDWVNHIIKNPAKEVQDQVCQLMILMGVFYGRKFEKLLKIGLSEGSSSLFISEEGFHIHLGSNFEDAEDSKNRIYEEGEFVLPWNSLFLPWIKTIFSTKGEFKFLREFLGKDALGDFYNYVCSNFELSKGRVKAISSKLDHAHMYYGAIRLQYPIPYVSILQAKPFGWTRGAGSYVGLEAFELFKIQKAIESEILKDCGVLEISEQGKEEAYESHGGILA